MKKLMAIITAAAFVVTLASCSSNPASSTATAPSTTAAASSSMPAGSAVVATASEGAPITITAGDRTITAMLNDSAVSRDFVAKLPVSLPWFRNAGIEYISELDAPMTETGPFYTTVEAGDRVYYNPLDSITIIYAPTSSVPTVTKMGEITSDLSIFKDLPDEITMTIAVA